MSWALAIIAVVPYTIPNLTACLDEPSFFSCENTTVVRNACCSPSPGGLVLQTQFWDTWTGLEHKGQLLPRGSWGIHGLWPDNCDGSFEQYCDFSRQFDPQPSPAILPNGTVIPPWNGTTIDTFIKDFGRFDLLEYMNKFWINQGAPNTDFWAHEFSKHATCTSTFDVSCFEPGYKKHEDVINFFDAVIRAFKMFPTYDILASAGIVPSNKTAYSLSQIQNALKVQAGAVPFLGCAGNGTILNEVWWFNHILGTEQYGFFKHIDSVTPSTCSSTKPIRYFERSPGSEREVH
ncbi:ribonuclease T2 [Punctularia strigosozonata HHB-11173 SS5]|uniref:ribonuclease T2 n=1 Tax=Punctularia strigosozonata (strain HHB-11173) TaxID=741275 RepID=UPI0004416C03|nr:ribonuclease T2 [Punctularia strigosozonata HHB-11173 SS5]EIN14001.1 ribonuclease T2 [Punctularia strigosozonata HHB-11173 SS5]